MGTHIPEITGISSAIICLLIFGEVIGTAVVVIVHLLKRNTLLSIFLGTVVYMLLTRYLG